MPRTVKLDLRGAPPVAGGMRDHIPPGRYRIKVVQIDDGTSKSGKRMFTASYKVEGGSNHGANLGDNFVLVDNNNAPSKIGLGRLHHFLLCINFPVKEAALSFDLDTLTGRECEVEVADEEFVSNGTSRITSAIRGYFSGRPAAPATNGATNGAAAPAAEPAAAPVAEAPAPVAAPPVEAAPVAAATEDAAPVEEVVEEEVIAVGAQIDDLFK
jgi:hypothetical protein